MRRAAHHYFDQLYLSGMMSREDAYQWLAQWISAPLSEAHIGHLGEYYCRKVIEESQKFSTYAYRLIWNEICDTLIAAGRRQARETACDVLPEEMQEKKSVRRSVELKMDLKRAFEQAKTQAPPFTAKGMEAMRLMAAGYSSREIGERMEASDKLVCAWVSRARKVLKGRREFMEFAREYGY